MNRKITKTIIKKFTNHLKNMQLNDDYKYDDAKKQEFKMQELKYIKG